jgi:ethanolamine ammonia-lyase small subunit
MITESNLKSIIEQVMVEMQSGEISKSPNITDNTCDACSDDIKDITAYRIEDYFAVENAENPDAYKKYKKSTPSRVGISRTGTRYKTETMLRFRADHAVAQDAVFNDVSDEFIAQKGWLKAETVIKDKDEYLTRPDLGRIVSDDSIKLLRERCKNAPQVQVYISDGLSSIAVETNAYDALKAIEQGLELHGIEMGTPFFLKHGRVPAMDHVSELLKAEVTVVLIGERPGLATGESMSCYMTYRGKVGNPESIRTVVSNIHKSGTPAVEAGAHIADIIKTMLKEKKSGVDLKL